MKLKFGIIAKGSFKSSVSASWFVVGLLYIHNLLVTSYINVIDTFLKLLLKPYHETR